MKIDRVGGVLRRGCMLSVYISSHIRISMLLYITTIIAIFVVFLIHP